MAISKPYDSAMKKATNNKLTRKKTKHKCSIHSLKCTLNHVNNERNDKPFPEIWPMKNEQHPKWNVQQMCPVEYFKTTATPDKWLRTQKHNDEHDK